MNQIEKSFIEIQRLEKCEPAIPNSTIMQAILSVLMREKESGQSFVQSTKEELKNALIHKV